MKLRNRKSFTSNIAFTSALAIMVACWSTNAAAIDLPLPKLPSFKSMSLDGSYYGGAGFGSSGIEPNVNSSGFVVTESASSGVQLFIGRDISPRISVEGYVSQLGEAQLNNIRTGDSGAVDYSSFGASGLLYLIGGSGSQSLANRSGFGVYGRVGFGRINNTGIGVDYSRADEWSVSTGLGAEYNMKNGFGLRAEFHNFDSDARVVSLNVVKRFRLEKKGGRLSFQNRKDDLVIAAAIAARDSDGDGVDDYADNCSGTEKDVLVGANGCEFSQVLEGVTFSTGSSKLTESGTQALDQVIDALNQNTDINVSVQAHTDNRGDAKKNMTLSRKRAENVVRYLADDGGVSLDRITAIGYGESRPLKSNRTAEGREANRRVEIKVTE